MTMQSIQILMDEHQVILRALRAAEGLCRKMTAEKQIFADDTGKVLDFIRLYADEFHHMKEEDVLFRWMGEAGFPVEGGPIQVMLHEHDIGREYVQAAAAALASGKNDNDSLEAITSNLNAFAGHLTQHIFKEDNILYPMADRIAGDNPEADAELLRRYGNKISAESATRTNEHYRHFVAELEKKYGA